MIKNYIDGLIVQVIHDDCIFIGDFVMILFSCIFCYILDMNVYYLRKSSYIQDFILISVIFHGHHNHHNYLLISQLYVY